MRTRPCRAAAVDVALSEALSALRAAGSRGAFAALVTIGLCAGLACEPQASPHNAASVASPASTPDAPPGPGLSPDDALPPEFEPEALYDRPRADIYEISDDIRYVELITGGAMPEAELPMVIALHGRGDRPERFAQLLRGFDRPARVVLPVGIIPATGGFAWFKIRARDRDVEGFVDGVTAAADRLAEFIDVITVERPTAGKPVLTGFSQGGIVSFAIATRHPEKIAAAYPIGGWLPPALWPEAGPPDVAAPPIIALHGDADRVLPVAPTRRAVSKLQALGFPVVLREYQDVPHEITVEMRRLLWKQLSAATLAIRAGNPIQLPPRMRRRRRTAAAQTQRPTSRGDRSGVKRSRARG